MLFPCKPPSLFRERWEDACCFSPVPRTSASAQIQSEAGDAAGSPLSRWHFNNVNASQLASSLMVRGERCLQVAARWHWMDLSCPECSR